MSSLYRALLAFCAITILCLSTVSSVEVGPHGQNRHLNKRTVSPAEAAATKAVMKARQFNPHTPPTRTKERRLVSPPPNNCQTSLVYAACINPINVQYSTCKLACGMIPTTACLNDCALIYNAQVRCCDGNYYCQPDSFPFRIGLFEVCCAVHVGVNCLVTSV